MRIFVGSLMIFFGTLLMAGLLVLGQPSDPGVPAYWPYSTYHSEYGAHEMEPQTVVRAAFADWRTLVALLHIR